MIMLFYVVDIHVYKIKLVIWVNRRASKSFWIILTNEALRLTLIGGYIIIFTNML